MNTFLELLFSKRKWPVGKTTCRLSHRTRAFLPAIFLIALIGVCIPEASTQADPLVPSDLILGFHIVENGKPYQPTIKLSYLQTHSSTNDVHYSFDCAQNCVQFISFIWTGIELGSYSLLVEVGGGKSFTIANFNIYYTRRYDVQINPTVYLVIIDVGQRSCTYISNDSDKNFRIDGCGRKQSDANDRATESADSIAIATAEAQRQETQDTFNRTDTILYLATASAKAQRTETALALSTALAEAQGTETAAALTNEKAPAITPTPSITSTIQPILATAANQALSLAALPGAQPTETTAPTEERSTIGAPWGNILPFLSIEYFVAIAMAVLVESAVAFLLIRIIYKISGVSSWRIFLACLIINFATIPCAWRIMGLLVRVLPIEYYFLDIVMTETLVVIVEAMWYRIVLPIRLRQALLLSFCANSVSYFVGVILFGF